MNVSQETLIGLLTFYKCFSRNTIPLLATNVSQETLIKFLNFDFTINVSQETPTFSHRGCFSRNIKFSFAISVSQETLILFLNFAF
jgi:hypothetical protein